MTNATAFEEEMTEIWDEDAQDQYEDWHNAVHYAKERWSATRLYMQERNSEPGVVYEFPDGSKAWVHIEGKACAEVA